MSWKNFWWNCEIENSCAVTLNDQEETACIYSFFLIICTQCHYICTVSFQLSKTYISIYRHRSNLDANIPKDKLCCTNISDFFFLCTCLFFSKLFNNDHILFSQVLKGTMWSKRWNAWSEWKFLECFHITTQLFADELSPSTFSGLCLLVFYALKLFSTYLPRIRCPSVMGDKISLRLYT